MTASRFSRIVAGKAEMEDAPYGFAELFGQRRAGMNAKKRIEEPRSEECLSRAEALAVLGVKAETLYSYVSRGLIRRVAVADGRSLYARRDVEHMKARSMARAGHGPVAAAAVHWGEPILTTHITQVSVEGPQYRSIPATDLARNGKSFGDVARFLWTASWAPEERTDIPVELPRHLAGAIASQPGLHIRHLLAQTVLALAFRPPADGETFVARSDRIMRALAGALGLLGPTRSFVPARRNEELTHHVLRALGGQTNGAAVSLLDKALILCADHDLTPSTFVARIAASVGADIYGCLGAALNAHFGARFGLGFDRIEEYLAAHTNRDRTDDSTHPVISYFHPLYPDGDPRARFIIALLLSTSETKSAAASVMTQISRMPARNDAEPTLEEALVVLSKALGLPDQAAGALFALARAAGWLAHIREQQDSSFIIRPRGKFEPADSVAIIGRERVGTFEGR